MIALYIIGGIVLLLILLSLLRVGVLIRFGETLYVWAKAGPVKVQVLPKADKPHKEAKPKKKKAAPEKPKNPRKKPKPTLDDVLTLAPAIWESLKRGLQATHQRLRIQPLDVSVILGGHDPADVAKYYGWANAAMWTVMPELQRRTRMPDPHVHLGMDYEAEKTAAQGEVGINLQIRDIFAIGFAFIKPVARWYLERSREKKRREKEEMPPQEEAAAAQHTEFNNKTA